MSTETQTVEETKPRGRGKGLGKLIVTVYGILALAATFRSVFQIIDRFDAAPLAFSLSAVAAVVYIVATICLGTEGVKTWWAAFYAVIIEAIGVIGVGIFSFSNPEMFPESTVWSHFGSGYGYIPLVLPFVGFLWLLKHRPQDIETQAQAKLS